MSRLFAEKNKIRIAHKHSNVFPNDLVLVRSHEFGSRIQIKEVKKIKRNLIFSIMIQVFLMTLHESNLDERRIMKIIGELAKLRLILGR